MELFETHCPDIKINIDKNNTYMTCTQNWEVPVSYQRCHNKTGEACEKSGELWCWVKSSYEIVKKSVAHSVTICFTADHV